MIFVFLYLTFFTSFGIISSRFIHLIRTDSNAFFLWLSNNPLYVCTTSSYSFICQQTAMLFPCPSYCKQCCSERWVAYAFWNYGIPRLYVQKWICWVIWQFYFQFFKDLRYCSPYWVHQFTFPSTSRGFVLAIRKQKLREAK